MWIAVSVLVLLTASVIWFLQTHERRDITVPYPQSAEARRNPLLASQRFLRRMGMPAEEAKQILRDNRSLGPSDSLLLLTPRRALSEQRGAELLAWAKEGGHLVIVARDQLIGEDSSLLDELTGNSNEILIDDPLLDSLGVERHYIGEDAGRDPFEIATSPRGLDIQVEFQPVIQLHAGSGDFEVLAGSDDASCALHRDYGRGALTILCSRAPFLNNSVGENDHAAFLWDLVNLHAEPSKVWLVHRDDMPALPVWLWRQAPFAIVGLGVLLFVALWTKSRRFGPTVDIPALDRRRMLEHIDASGRFAWERGNRRHMLVPIRKSFEREVVQHHPGWKSLSRREQAERLAHMTELSAGAVEQTLNTIGDPPLKLDEATLTKTLQNLQTIRKQL